ncbi:Mitochondrial glycine decarboxylase complex subunit H [Komagataella phaffii CBS 7435]|uniref:Glycine cleavage system H protein n=2 Tax=Komagataella phaffii TaxID=460519 RepID=C4QZ66_KOMPG|nr:H subunit of the mitochondrial glycine decarboxylase complex [Komagataella phaffii GS115]AOA61586.1 GQ67_01458T0 [Komagataella phaffii]CAH2447368.1 Mitochondrial glycine decarboxylase complex subunit H [Komagataella phaffii CBS 7435]AOA66522.1 GQ68_01474T0 [Komagataella phaffii GS115]CAY68540.1 H subunit of the mitochondrial glycine decarboxylase complex [Komagataella phaffii GS115]CCA37601.1 Mitochondrial glycine decarboxylase complex subunit H [Komagataella phaffii CBS 7435]
MLAPLRIAVRPMRPVAAALGSRILRFNSTVAQANSLNPSAVPFKFSDSVTVRYTREHEWLASHPDGTAFVGITKYAADALGDATFVEVPEVGDSVQVGDSIGSVESVKSASEIYTPVDGEILEANDELTSNPALINSDPLGEGWIAKLKVTDPDQLLDAELFDIDAYVKFLQEES